MVTAAIKLKDAPWKKSDDQSRQHIKKQGHFFADKGPCNKSYGFSSGHVGCESWTINKAEHQIIDDFELWRWKKTFEGPLDCKEIKPINPKGNIDPEYSLERLMLKLKL